MTRLQLIQQVALHMDEVSPEITIANLSVDGSDNNPLYTLIDGLVDAGALELFSIAPYWRLEQTEFGDGYVKTESVGTTRKINDGQGQISARKIIRLRVPDDFLRVAEISHPSFQRPITEVVPEMSEMGKRQHNPFLMAKEARPVGVMSHGEWTLNAGTESEETLQCREIDCYSIPSSGTTTGLAATYIAKPRTIKDSSPAVTVEEAIPPVLIPALKWLIASRAFGARGDANHASICQQNAQNVLV